MRHTPVLNLKLPDSTDYVQIEDINENMETLEQEIVKISGSTTDLEEQLTTHTADNKAHGIGDRATLLTAEKATLVGAVNELFTDVSNGKTAIGTAITDTDPSKVVPPNPTFAQLDTLIRTINTGKKIAKGSLNSDSSGVVTVTGLAFKPTVVILYRDLNTPAPTPLGIFMAASENVFIRTINVVYGGNSSVNQNVIGVTATGFTASTNQAGALPYGWTALG